MFSALLALIFAASPSFAGPYDESIREIETQLIGLDIQGAEGHRDKTVVQETKQVLFTTLERFRHLNDLARVGVVTEGAPAHREVRELLDERRRDYHLDCESDLTLVDGYAKVNLSASTKADISAAARVLARACRAFGQ